MENDTNSEFSTTLAEFAKKIPNWEKLSDENRWLEIEKSFHESSNKTSDEINKLHNLKDSFILLLLGILLGIVGNLWANIIYDSLKNDFLDYLLVLIVLTCGVLVLAIDIFLKKSNTHIKKIDGYMLSNPITRHFWKKRN